MTHAARLERPLERMRAAHSYWAVLAAIFVIFFLSALTPDAAWATSLIVLVCSATLLIAIWTAGWRVTDRVVAFALATVGAVGATVNLLWQGKTLDAVLAVVAGLLILAIAIVVAAGAVAQGEVNIRSVGGAICVYVLLGMVFVSVYGFVAIVQGTPFFAQGTDGTRALRTYFSFVTLATLGYGDYTPATNLGHGLAVFEALLGQLYLVTVVAVVVARLGRPRDR